MIGKVALAFIMLPVWAAAAYFVPVYFAWFTVGVQTVIAFMQLYGYLRIKSQMERETAELLYRFAERMKTK